MGEERGAHPAGPSDEALMQDYQAGDLSAFDVLYVRYEKRVFSYLLRQIGDPEAAADLFQETFLRLHRSREDYDPNRSFLAWIFTIAGNLVRTEFKRRSSRLDERAETDVEHIGGGTPTDARAEQAEMADRIRAALDALPQEQRQVILLNKCEGLSYREIAEITRSTAAAVKQMAYRALLGLRNRLKDVV